MTTSPPLRLYSPRVLSHGPKLSLAEDEKALGEVVPDFPFHPPGLGLFPRLRGCPLFADYDCDHLRSTLAEGASPAFCSTHVLAVYLQRDFDYCNLTTLPPHQVGKKRILLRVKISLGQH